MPYTTRELSTKEAIGRRFRKSLLKNHPDFCNYTILFYEEEYNRYWIYDEDAIKTAQLLRCEIHHTPDGNVGLSLKSDIFDNIINDFEVHAQNYIIKKKSTIKIYDYVGVSSFLPCIHIGTQFKMMDLEDSSIKEYIIADPDFSKLQIVTRTDGTCEIINVPIHSINEVTRLNPASEIAASILGKSVGSIFRCNGFEYKIIEIL